MVAIEELFDPPVWVNPTATRWRYCERMSTSLSSVISLLPAVSVVITGVVLGILMGRHDNRAEERYDP